jgi:hypothetical protein
LLKKADDGWECIDVWVCDTMAIAEDHCRDGLGTELFLHTVQNRNDLPASTNFSLGGYNLVRRALERAKAEAKNCNK